jgi:transposase
MWLRPRKTWQNPTQPVRLVINKDRGKNVTVYGAIGVCLPGAFFRQAETTNQTATQDFLNQLRAFSKLELTEPIHLILDNHRSHHTLAVKQTMIDNNIVPHFIPPYTPEFNSIEALWSWIKRDVKKRLVDRNNVHLSQQEFQTMLKASLNSVTYEAQSKAATSNNREFMRRILGDCLIRIEQPALFVRNA